MLLLLLFFSLVFHCLLLYVCLLRPIIILCALDMLLIKATYLLKYEHSMHDLGPLSQ